MRCPCARAYIDRRRQIENAASIVRTHALARTFARAGRSLRAVHRFIAPTAAPFAMLGMHMIECVRQFYYDVRTYY